ncbi:D-2-hydroxyacid dehydrogenase [Glaciecola siphonariae]|uniref:D-2-hydroxyacid dehydrogenase n=1 Tax=Glaciecola siphonariae TaxID=521012 RepID=A0ABV9M0D3_9ALTE
MHKLAIISRDFFLYRDLFASIENDFDTVQLIYAGPAMCYENNTAEGNTHTHDTQAYVNALNEASIVLSEPDIGSDNLDKLSKLKWLQSTWAGNNKLQHHKKRDYMLTGTKGIFAEQMREYVFAYILFFTRQIAQFTSLQGKRLWQQPAIPTLAGKRIGIMGMGSIGIEVAKMAHEFGMTVSAITSQNKVLDEVDYFTLEQRTSFATHCDVIVNLLPETEQTIGVCDEDFFAAMKADAVFINAGRGSVVKSDETLFNTLKEKKIKAAVLDVFTQEPLTANHPFYQLNNCYLTNHTAAVSDPKKVFSVFKDNLQRFVTDAPLLHQHDFVKGY